MAMSHPVPHLSPVIVVPLRRVLPHLFDDQRIAQLRGVFSFAGESFPSTCRSTSVPIRSLDNLQASWYMREQGSRQLSSAFCVRQIGPTHPDVVCSPGNLASVLARQHQRAQARPLLERARQLYLAMSQANVDLPEEAARGILRQEIETLRAYAALLRHHSP